MWQYRWGKSNKVKTLRLGDYGSLPESMEENTVRFRDPTHGKSAIVGLLVTSFVAMQQQVV